LTDTFFNIVMDIFASFLSLFIPKYDRFPKNKSSFTKF